MCPCTIYLCLSSGEMSGGRRSQKDVTESEERGAEGDITGTLTDNASEATRLTQNLHFVNSKLELHMDEQVKLHEKIDERLSSQQDELSTKHETLMKKNSDLSKQNSDLRSEVDMLKALAVKQSNEIGALKRGLVDLQTHSMEDNIFHNVAESRGENCEGKVRDILKSKSFKGNIFVFEKIHRMGKYVPTSTHPRPIVAKLASYQQRSTMLQFGSKLPKDMKQFRITPQFPPSVREKRRQLSEVAEAAKATDKKVSTKIASDSLYINGECYREKLPCPTPRELLYMSDVERTEAMNKKFIECSVTVGGCTFVARAASAISINDVRLLYKGLLLNPQNVSATHNIAGYRLYSPVSSKTEDGYNDDGDFGLGRVIRNTLQECQSQNVAVFVTRFYGGAHLGSQRFAAVKDLVKSALEKFKNHQ